MEESTQCPLPAPVHTQTHVSRDTHLLPDVYSLKLLPTELSYKDYLTPFPYAVRNKNTEVPDCSGGM